MAQSRNYRKSRPRLDPLKLYIICEGSKKEPDYFDYFQEYVSNLTLIPLGSADGKTDPEQLLRQAEEVFGGDSGSYHLDYRQKDQVWFVIDTDLWAGKIETLRKYCKENNQTTAKVSGYEAWHVVQSNPCFEIWLYYHLCSEKPLEERVAAHKSFKDYLNQVNPGGFCIHPQAGLIEEAITNAKRYHTPGQQVDLYTTEVYLLAEVMLPYIKRLLDKKLDLRGAIPE